MKTASSRTGKKQNDQKLLIYLLVTLLILMAIGLGWALFARGSQVASLLYTQQAESGSFVPIKDRPGVYKLTLTRPDSQTVFFSDRPKRISGVQPTETFIKSSLFTRSNPPNAAVVIHDPKSAEQDVVIVELTNPRFTPEDNTLVYDALLLNKVSPGLNNWEADKDANLPEHFNQVSIFIDNGASTNEDEVTANVSVTVTDTTNKPVEGAQVALYGTSRQIPSETANTNANGIASFNGIYPGDALRQGFYRIIVSKQGYKTNDSATTNACANQTDSIAITLLPQ